MNNQLYIFDADGTLVTRDGRWLPGVVELLPALRQAGHAIAIATNQGGPACYDAGWPWSRQFPTLEEVESAYNDLARVTGARLYMSLLYQVKSTGQFIAPAGIPADDPRLNPEWRKPKPGMLLQAMVDVGASPADTVFVGDGEEDRLAAEAAGIRFIYAYEFFKRQN